MSRQLGFGRERAALGAQSPSLVIAPTEQDRAGIQDKPLTCDASTPPRWAVMAAHGGGGASTLTRWWPEAADTAGLWPGNGGTTQLVVIAARECMPGLAAAATRLREWHAQLAPPGVVVVGLVLSAVRAGWVPEPVRRYRDIVSPLVAGAVYRIGWHDDLVWLEPTDLTPCRALPDAATPRRDGSAGAAPRDAGKTAEQIARSIEGLRKTGLLHQL